MGKCRTQRVPILDKPRKEFECRLKLLLLLNRELLRDPRGEPVSSRGPSRLNPLQASGRQRHQSLPSVARVRCTSQPHAAGRRQQHLHLARFERCRAAELYFWLDPKMGITYTVAAQTLQYSINSINTLQNTPIPIHAISNRSELLGNMPTLSPAVLPVVVNHHNGAPVFDIDANTQTVTWARWQTRLTVL